ncbi:hypothetical protein BDV32DRAFT_161418 [Aspergillus pseudonomiae]|nr:hypothetical protein BDV32DRAFT_161418 [Aspergillus pseudonomiae]
MATLIVSLLLTLLAHEVLGLSPVRVSHELGPHLSPSALITGANTTAYPRWSEFDAPKPGVVVTVATEHDVAKTVHYCTSNGIPFLAQNGGHGWADTFHLGAEGLLINIKQLNTIDFNDNKTEVTVGGGVEISEVIAAASKNGALVQTGNCNCVGALGAILGGGYGNLIGLMGLGVDNVLLLNVVMADGRLHTITPKDGDLWWAMLGAGPNFGIVTSAKLKALPVSPSGQTAWFGQLIYTADKVEAVVEAIDKITLEPKMNLFLYYLNSGSPDYTPMLVITPFYYGTEAEGRAAFATFLDLGPAEDTTIELQYPHWNDAAAGFCTKGGYKPAYTVGLARMNPSTWKEVWDEYASYIVQNGTGGSLILMEAYSLKKARSIPESSTAFALRNNVNFNAVVIPWYYDTSLRSGAEAFGSKIRDLWRSTDELDSPATYINFAHGDEDLTTIFGANVDRLRAIKARVDPGDVFNQWFNL